MFWIAIILVFIFLVVLAAAYKQRFQNGGITFSYKKQTVLFTPAERSFLGVLDLAVGKDFRLFGKVRAGDVLAPQNGSNNRVRTTALNKINRKHFDFVLCQPDDLSVLCVIELNDKSHQQKSRQDRDEFLVEACRGAGLPLIMLDAKHAYSPTEISARIAEAMAGHVTNRIEPRLQQQAKAESPVNAPGNETAPSCPRCSSMMVKRTATGGSNAGKYFWGCSNFPKCREIVTL